MRAKLFMAIMYSDLKTYSEIINILKKCLDMEPSPVVFSAVNSIQEYMIDGDSDEGIIRKFELILETFLEYSDYTPSYFSGHINLYFGLIGKYSEKLTVIVSKILQNYAKKGEDRIDELFFDIYEKTSHLSVKVQPVATKILQESLSYGGSFIFEKIFQEKMEFPKHITKMVQRNLKNPPDTGHIPFYEITLEIARAMWKYEFGVLLLPGKEHLPPLKRLMKPITEVLHYLVKYRIYSPYMFMQTISDIDHVLQDAGASTQANEFEEKYLKEDQINSEEKFFDTASKFLAELEQFSKSNK